MAGKQIDFFVKPDERIKKTFAHEAGHLVNLLDDFIPEGKTEGNNTNIMSYGMCGTKLGDGYYDKFKNGNNPSALTDRFCVKEK